MKYTVDLLLNLVEISFVSEGVGLTAAVLSVWIKGDVVDLGKPANFPSEPSALACSAVLVCVLLFYSSAPLTLVSTLVLSAEEREGKKTSESFSE